MKQRAIGALVLLGFLLLAVPTPAVERTGEVLRELVQGVEEDLERLEHETQGFAEKGEELTKELEEKGKLLDRARDPVRRETVTSDILLLGAKLNDLDRKEVEAALTTTNDVRWKLERIRDVLQRGGILPPREELPKVRQKMGKFLSTAAKLLERWPGKMEEAEALKATLVGVLPTWESPATNMGTSHEELSRTMEALDTTYSQLLTLGRALELERQDLMVRNNMAVARLVLLRLNGGKVNVGSVLDAAEGKRKALQHRREIITRTETRSSLGGKGGGGRLSSDGQAAYDRIKRGDYEWSKGGER